MDAIRLSTEAFNRETGARMMPNLLREMFDTLETELGPDMSSGYGRRRRLYQAQFDRFADRAHGRSKAETAGQGSIHMQIPRVWHRL